MATSPLKIPITVIIPVRNERENLGVCLRSVRGFEQVLVIDSKSTDGTSELAEKLGAEVHQFDYKGGWPKKRQWALETLPIRNHWTLLLDADERVTSSLRQELVDIVRGKSSADGYWVRLRLIFLGRLLNHGASDLKKLSFFRTGRGRFECLVKDQTKDMSDVEIHEHVMIDGKESECAAWLVHENVNSLFRYIEKHNEYSTWSSALAWKRISGDKDSFDHREESLRGTQADRRRWLMNRLWRLPAAGILMPLLRFAWFYFFRLGFLDGGAGYYYCGFKAVQAFHTMAKVKELSLNATAQPKRGMRP